MEPYEVINSIEASLRTLIYEILGDAWAEGTSIDIEKLKGKRKAEAASRSLRGMAFDFGRFYGPHGFDYIEVHHHTPLHVTGETETKLADLALLCSNCHRMIHRAKKWLTVEELRELVNSQNRPA